MQRASCSCSSPTVSSKELATLDCIFDWAALIIIVFEYPVLAKGVPKQNYNSLQ